MIAPPCIRPLSSQEPNDQAGALSDDWSVAGAICFSTCERTSDEVALHTHTNAPLSLRLQRLLYFHFAHSLSSFLRSFSIHHPRATRTQPADEWLTHSAAHSFVKRRGDTLPRRILTGALLQRVDLSQRVMDLRETFVFVRALPRLLDSPCPSCPLHSSSHSILLDEAKCGAALCRRLRLHIYRWLVRGWVVLITSSLARSQPDLAMADDVA